jgi:hypothetical protein
MLNPVNGCASTAAVDTSSVRRTWGPVKTNRRELISVACCIIGGYGGSDCTAFLCGTESLFVCRRGWRRTIVSGGTTARSLSSMPRAASLPTAMGGECLDDDEEEEEGEEDEDEEEEEEEAGGDDDDDDDGDDDDNDDDDDNGDDLAGRSWTSAWGTARSFWVTGISAWTQRWWNRLRRSIPMTMMMMMMMMMMMVMMMMMMMMMMMTMTMMLSQVVRGLPFGVRSDHPRLPG